MKIKFLGGVGTVTGSMHLVETSRRRVLLECGMFQGHRDEAGRINRHVPTAAVAADFMILSHSHIDHSGNIPNLVKSGFHHQIYTTHASRDLTALLLQDSALIQEADLRFLNRRRDKAGLEPRTPIYTMEDVDLATRYLTGHPYEQSLECGDVTFTLREAGHILGSAQVELEAEGQRIIFSGDLGRSNLPIIRDPVQPTMADYLIIESTYGNHLHPPFSEVAGQLATIVKEVVARRGRIVIPAFALGRTQEVVYTLDRLISDGQIPEIPVFVDSPLAINITEIFRRHQECFDAEALRLFAHDPDVLGFRRLTYVRNQSESMKLNRLKEPCIIISGSGMAEGGRVLHHLKHAVTDPRNVILIVGFVAQHTLARRIIEHQSPIRIFGEEYTLNARVEVIDAFSAHADQSGLLQYITGLDRTRLKKVFLVHGEPSQSEALQQILLERGYDAIIPEKGQEVEL